MKDLADVRFETGINRFTVSVIGHTSFALLRIDGVSTAKKLSMIEDTTSNRRRVFEVTVHELEEYRCMEVITRNADDVTRAIARGYALLVAEFWQGQLEV